LPITPIAVGRVCVVAPVLMTLTVKSETKILPLADTFLNPGCVPGPEDEDISIYNSSGLNSRTVALEGVPIYLTMLPSPVGCVDVYEPVVPSQYVTPVNKPVVVYGPLLITAPLASANIVAFASLSSVEDVTSEVFDAFQ
jgi:hypothetical protein